jgi:hypothetical protein
MKTFWIKAKELTGEILAISAIISYAFVGTTLMLLVMSSVGGIGGVILGSLVAGAAIVVFEKAHKAVSAKFGAKESLVTVQAEQPLAAN